MEEKISASLGKIARTETARIAAAQKYWKDVGMLSDVLSRLSSKDMSKDGGEAAYGMCFLFRRSVFEVDQLILFVFITNTVVL